MSRAVPSCRWLEWVFLAFMWTASSLNQPKIKIIKNIKKIKIIKSWVEPTEENSRGDNDSAAIRGDNN
ncbi:hypothetical protein PWA56_00060 [Bifidobacterium longum subsp. longum]|uniref:Uncharacterized protein n=1 Tax=Bifidobacterium longum subsp. longum TaxID=1679 RepID=A0ABD7WKI6_BIFLL|nr:hypothetical protein [Bifidobacterium longum]WDY40310.1 hypothetical protein PWA56_00060 [Bifidobacterium longum subsp. longum]